MATVGETLRSTLRGHATQRAFVQKWLKTRARQGPTSFYFDAGKDSLATVGYSINRGDPRSEPVARSTALDDT